MRLWADLEKKVSNRQSQQLESLFPSSTFNPIPKPLGARMRQRRSMRTCRNRPWSPTDNAGLRAIKASDAASPLLTRSGPDGRTVADFPFLCVNLKSSVLQKYVKRSRE
jgi:hypothetical protein